MSLGFNSRHLSSEIITLNHLSANQNLGTDWHLFQVPSVVGSGDPLLTGCITVRIIHVLYCENSLVSLLCSKFAEYKELPGVKNKNTGHTVKFECYINKCFSMCNI